MDHDPRGWLWDVRRAADDVAAFVQGRGFDEYLTGSIAQGCQTRFSRRYSNLSQPAIIAMRRRNQGEAHDG
jgi:hypothetical protein